MRRLVYALPLLALPLAVAACGGKSSSSTPLPHDPVAAVKGAASKTVQAGSEHVHLVGRVVAGSQTVTFNGAGDFDTQAHLGSLHGEFSAGGLNGVIDEVTSGTISYLKSELLTALVPGGKTWVKIDLAKTAKARGINVTSVLSQDPTEALTQLQALRDVQKIGTETVAGETTTHYRARLDLSKLKGVAQAGLGRYDVWIGEDGYVHRVKAIVTTGGATSTLTTDLSKFGEPVKVTVPKAADTFDGTKASIPGLTGG